MTKKANAWNRRLNRFFKKGLLPSVIISGVCVAAAVICSLRGSAPTAARVFYLLSALFAGIPILYKALQSLRMKVIGIELLVTVAVAGALLIGEFSEAGIVTFLFQLGNLLELKTLTRTRNTIRSLAAAAPKTALLRRDGVEEEIDAELVEPGDILSLRVGRMAAADGVIIEGEAYFTEASVTGEPAPVHKTVGDPVYSGTIVDSGDARMEATACGEDSTYSRIIALVEEAQDAKSPAVRFIDRFARWYTPFVIALAAAVFLLKLLFFHSADLDTAITILVLACPGALVIGVPVADAAGIGNAAASHILLKGGDVIDRYGKTEAFVFDKTGTLTEGNMTVVGFRSFGDDPEADKAAVVQMERKSDHPLGRAILAFHRSDGRAADQTELPVTTHKGRGLEAMADGVRYLAGSAALLEEHGVAFEGEAAQLLAQTREEASSVVWVARGEKPVLLYRIADAVREDAAECIAALKRRGAKVILMTGDHEAVGQALAEELGLDEAHCDLLPQDKAELVKELKEKYRVCFVGDGINDSPALTLADTGIAVGSAAEVAVEAADIVVLRKSLTDVVLAGRICERIRRIRCENIAIAVGTVCFLLVGLFAGFIHMSIGMFVHEASILAVILNAMRLTITKNHEGGTENEKERHSAR